MNDIPMRQIRAAYDEQTIRVYQAYNDEIAEAALKHGAFVSPPFKRERMTWIKPSFLWMMYRAGWGFKDAGQARILAIDISREGFAWALANSCPSHPEPDMDPAEWTRLKDSSPVRVQWDPERNLRLEPLPHRSIQIGLGKTAVDRYVGDWIQRITDVTDLAHAMHARIEEGDLAGAEAMRPAERIYPMPA